MEIGDKVRFSPYWLVGEKDPAQPHKAAPLKFVTGTVVYINIPHRYYTLQYNVAGVTLRESFKN